MTPDRELILVEALKLSQADREILVNEILASLSMNADASPSSEWTDVVAQRLQEIDQGRVELVPGDEVMEKLRAIASRRS